MKKTVIISLSVVLALVGISFTQEATFPHYAENTTRVELPQVKNTAFKRGEKVSYRLHYGFIDAGKGTLTVTNEEKKFGSRKTFHVVGVASTQGVSDWFFKVRDRYESYIDEKAIIPWRFIRHVDEGGYKFSQDYFFNHYLSKVTTQKKEVFSITPGMQDMFSAFYRARNLDYSNVKKGDVFTIDCFVDEEVFPIKIKYIGRKTVKTKIGKFKCLQFRPIIQTGRIFKDEEDLNMWISDDGNHIPIKVKADILFGSIQIEITDYEGLANPIAKVK